MRERIASGKKYCKEVSMCHTNNYNFYLVLCNLVLRSMDIVNAKSIAPFIFSCLFSVLRFFGGECKINAILKKSWVLGNQLLRTSFKLIKHLKILLNERVCILHFVFVIYVKRFSCV